MNDENVRNSMNFKIRLGQHQKNVERDIQQNRIIKLRYCLNQTKKIIKWGKILLKEH